MSTGRPRLRAVRAASAVVMLASVSLLGLVVAESGGSVTRHTVVTKHAVKEAAPAVPATPQTSAPGSDVSVPAPVASAPTPTAASVASPLPVVASTPVVTSPAVTTPAATPTPAGAAPTAPNLPACPLGLPAPTATGGLQSLIGFAPLFGPFSAEAFASAAAFQPVLELLGPFLVAFAQQYAPLEPSLAPLLSQVESLEAKGYSLIAPFYGPYRTQFLSAETQLATALAPLASTVRDNPAASCLIDIEGALTSAAH